MLNRVECEDVRGHLVQECPVVRDDEHRPRESPHIRRNLSDPIDIQVIRGLIQEQDVWPLCPYLGQCQACDLTP